MLPNPDDDSFIRRFLVGEVSAEERQLVEDRFMSDSDYFETVEVVEEQMILEYLRGELPVQWRAAFTSAILDSPARERRVAEMRTFLSTLEGVAREGAAKDRRPNWLSWLRAPQLGMVAAAAGVAIVVAYVVWQPLLRSPGAINASATTTATPQPVAGNSPQNNPAIGSGPRQERLVIPRVILPEAPKDAEAEKLKRARNEKNFPRALELLEEIQKVRPAQPGLVEAFLQVGNSAKGAADLPTALLAFQRATELDPASLDARDSFANVRSVMTREGVLATAAAAEAKRVESARKASIALFNEGQKLEQQRQYDAADAKYREALATDKNNKQATAALGRSERYGKAKATGLAAIKANDRERALIALGDARSIDSARFLAEGLDKTISAPGAETTAGQRLEALQRELTNLRARGYSDAHQDVKRLTSAINLARREADIIGRRVASSPAPTPSATAPIPSAPRPALTADESAIAAVLGELARALSTETNKSRDLSVVRQVWPSAGGDVFGNNESQTYRFSNLVFLSPPGDKASVDCARARLMPSPTTGNMALFTDLVRIELEKAMGTWQVMSIVVRSK